MASPPGSRQRASRTQRGDRLVRFAALAPWRPFGTMLFLPNVELAVLAGREERPATPHPDFNQLPVRGARESLLTPLGQNASASPSSLRCACSLAGATGEKKSFVVKDATLFE